MPYLTADEYLERPPGIPEAVRLTDTTKSGEPDRDKIVEAIADASTYADAYLGGRYALPIADAPDLLKGIVFDLARERLHGTKATAAVTESADRARKLLADLSAGRASIPAPPNGTPPVINGSSLPALANDRPRRVFTDDALSDFTGFGGAGYGGTVFDGPRNW